MKKFARRLLFITLTMVCSSHGYAFTNPNAIIGSNYLVALPVERDRDMPVLVVLPGKHVSAKAEEDNWKFSATKNGFVLVTLEVDYDLIHEGSDVGRLHNRITKILRDLQKKKLRVSQKNVAIGGSSMGGMMALSLSLRYPREFTVTTVVCGGRLRFGAEQYLWAAKDRRFYLAHGDQDPVIPIDEFNETKAHLIENGGIVTFDIYSNRGHNLTGVYRKAVESILTPSEN